MTKNNLLEELKNLDQLIEDVLTNKQDDLTHNKPIVPKFIAEVIETFDDDVDYLHEHLSRQSEEVKSWLTHNERDFYEAWLSYPNIEVEKEKLYTVELPNGDGLWKYYFLSRIINRITIYYNDCEKWKNNKSNHLTESEIKENHSYLWQFAKEVKE
ncbi:TPA: DUF1642 domain-containing protein [Streptococcus agalactiae]|nr:DUF1642 domain-containing protein [Streptococcus agalactiae]